MEVEYFMNKIGAMPIRSFGEYTVHSCNDDVIRLNINVLIMNLLKWEWDKQENEHVDSYLIQNIMEIL